MNLLGLAVISGIVAKGASFTFEVEVSAVVAARTKIKAQVVTRMNGVLLYRRVEPFGCFGLLWGPSHFILVY